MAIGAATNCLVLINGVDLSDHAFSISVEDSRSDVDITAFGASNITITKGLGDGKFTIGLFQDFAAGKTHATLQPLIGSSTPVTVEVRNTNAARSTTNPGIVMSALLMNYSGLDVGNVGDASKITAEFRNGSQAGITYPTS